MTHCPRSYAVIVWTNWKAFMTSGSPVSMQKLCWRVISHPFATQMISHVKER